MFDVARIDQVGQKYLTLWHYMNDPLIFAVNQRIWQQLPEEDQQLLRQAAVDAGQWEIEMSREQKSERLAAIKERGVEVSQLTEDQRQAFVDITQSVYEKWTPQIGDELVKTARKAVDNR